MGKRIIEAVLDEWRKAISYTAQHDAGYWCNNSDGATNECEGCSGEGCGHPDMEVMMDAACAQREEADG